MAETPMGSDLEQLAIDWQDAGLPESKIDGLTAPLERRAEIDRQAQAAEGGSGVNTVAWQIAHGELDFAEGLAECQRRGAWSQQSSSSQRSKLGPTLGDTARGQCHSAARSFVQTHAQELASWLGLGRTKATRRPPRSSGGSSASASSSRLQLPRRPRHLRSGSPPTSLRRGWWVSVGPEPGCRAGPPGGRAGSVGCAFLLARLARDPLSARLGSPRPMQRHEVVQNEFACWARSPLSSRGCSRSTAHGMYGMQQAILSLDTATSLLTAYGLGVLVQLVMSMVIGIALLWLFVRLGGSKPLPRVSRSS